jgi:hypothetical protein
MYLLHIVEYLLYILNFSHSSILLSLSLLLL